VQSQALNQLSETLVWWNSLSFVERRLFANKARTRPGSQESVFVLVVLMPSCHAVQTQLVEMTEKAHMSSVGMLGALQKKYKQKKEKADTGGGDGKETKAQGKQRGGASASGAGEAESQGGNGKQEEV
jgi:hypothetical protein